MCKCVWAGPITTEHHTTAVHTLTQTTVLCRRKGSVVWVTFVKMYKWMYSREGVSVTKKSRCLLWHSGDEKFSVTDKWMALSPPCASDLWRRTRRRRRGCSGGFPGLLSSIHQPVHPPGNTGGTVHGGEFSHAWPVTTRQQRNVCTQGEKVDEWRVSILTVCGEVTVIPSFHLYTVHFLSPHCPAGLCVCVCVFSLLG